MLCTHDVQTDLCLGGGLSLSIPLPIKASELNKDVEARVLTQHGQDWTSLSWANKKATFCPTKIWPGEHEGAVIRYQIQRTMITLNWHLFICLGHVKLIENAIRPSQQCINQLLLAWIHAAPCEVENLWTQRRNNLEDNKKSHSLVTFREPPRAEKPQWQRIKRSLETKQGTRDFGLLHWKQLGALLVSRHKNSKIWCNFYTQKVS